ncbi:FecR domain-containing protein, partial [uncultured Aquincola sp.]|uniref:FecR domain-containing protein n=1 Tax=uncultured Aquincola sp. TaxID=886556 RepID=UPI0032B299F5
MKSRLALGALALALATAGLPVAAAEDMLPLVIQPGDSLWHLSNEVLTGPEAWREVARLNRLPDAGRIRAGQQLQVPLRLLRERPVPARLAVVQGAVTLDGRPVAAGEPVRTGQSLVTAADSSAVLELADGSRLRVQPGTETTLAQSARVAGRAAGAETPQPAAADAGATDGYFAGSMRLVRGSLEVLATKLRRAKPLEVQSPTAVIGVRGTEYRVHHGDDLGTRAEVLEGRVRADPAAAPEAGVELGTHFGTAIASPRATPQAVPLPEAPALVPLPPVVERTLVRLELPGETLALRAQVAVDPAFERIVSDQRVAAGSPVRITGLADGEWFLRVRRVQPDGIEGLDSQQRFTLAARPEPPAPFAPRGGGQVGVGRVTFRWAENVEAEHYHLQVARDAAFTDLVADLPELRGASTEVQLDQPGSYYWRMASVRPPRPGQRQRGPWTDPQALKVRAAPPAASAGTSADGKRLEL